MKKVIKKGAEEGWDIVANSYFDYRKSGRSMNHFIENPAMFKLIGNVNGLRVLDLGCGYGFYSFWAEKNGAKEVIGVDISTEMIENAKKEAKKRGSNIKFFKKDVKDLSEFNTNSFDLIMCSMTVAYFDDFEKYFSEFNRVLVNGGKFIFSDIHPIRGAGYWDKSREKVTIEIENYLDSRGVETKADWKDKDGNIVHIKGNYHPISKYSESLKKSGFLIGEIIEPKPIDEMKKEMPTDYEKYSRIPLFILFSAVKK